ncbi:MAG: helix-turn-helix transcriptional regulator [Pirellulales bacterium]
MALQTLTIEGKPYVILPRAEYERLATRAKASELPPLPVADRRGNVPAVEYARAGLARKIIRARSAAGLSQLELADLAGVREETICRLERGKHTPSIATLEKIDRALKRGKR